ncbi:hypothetical protein A3I48_01790 [Candidatus Daviesbacteria bacterium RIFCSPLOWO2_02_FULL_36_7]|uniref:Thioredoxin domain-containing protein n=1 Tax=Candidatus Daviesbacteria bacterium RIFCSPLOWO2_02_FULL_36_7 TaxID=1797792 RepID=A0A1F5MFX6_9BACT|nr:MAG: hypothetical protein A3I48_01790 [Candidatus Daviesbacteria bacterium RIFCSPLOWO2_02_FULL_36_7]
MTTETKILGSILIITLVLLFGGVFLLSRGSSSQSSPASIEEKNTVQIDYSKGEKIGSDSAKIKVVEFSDLECPACLAAEPSIKKLRSTYTDQIQFIYRHFPLTQHTHSRQVANLAEAAGAQGKFWEMHDKLFDTQAQWTILNKDDATVFFLSLAKNLGLDENKIKQDLQQDAYKSKIDDDLAEGQRLGVNSTPTFFVNGHKLNLESFDDLNTVVAQELKK